MRDRKSFLKYCVMILAISGLLIGGIKHGNAQVLCVNPGLGSGKGLLTLQTTLTRIRSEGARIVIQAFYGVTMGFIQKQIGGMIGQFSNFGKQFTNQFWQYDMKPAMQSMTGQLHTSATDASRNQGSFVDGQELARTTLLLKDAEVGAHRASRPSELQCEAATLTGGLFRINTIKDSYARAAPITQAGVSSASAGTPAGNGEDAYLNALWDQHCARYVDPQSNQGNTGCPAGVPAPAASGESYKAENIFADTYDVTDVEQKKNVDDFFRNICGPEPIARIQQEELDFVEGRRAFMKGMSRVAQEQLCYTALYHVQSKHVPGSQMDTLVFQHATKGGINIANVPANPSWTTVENVLEASTAQDFQTSLVDEPEAVERFLVIPDIYARTYGTNEIKDMQERTGALLAVLSVRELKDPSDAAASDSRR